MFWKNRSKKDDVFSVAAPVYVFTRMFGYWPFSVQFHQNTSKSMHVHMTCFDCLWLIVVLSIFTFFAWFSFVTVQDDIPYSSLELLVSKVTQLGSVSISILGIIMDMVNRKCIWDIIVRFNQFDNEVK